MAKEDRRDFSTTSTILDDQAPRAPSVPRPSEPGTLPVIPTRSEATQDDPLVGTTVGLYRLQSLIGAGAMGRVYLATHTSYGDERAVKILNASSSTDLRTRFVREAQTLLEVRHPNIVSVVDFGTERNGRSFIVMEYVAGESLHAYLTRAGTFEPARAADYAAQIASALRAVHEAGFVHRDLKPANVIAIRQEDQVQLKLVDFGLVGLLDPEGSEITRTGFVVGTLEYMAPELFTGGETTPKVDLYALGVMLYEMLAGTRPFPGRGADVARQHVEDPPPPLPIPSPVAYLAMMLLQKDPAKRPGIPRALAILRSAAG